MSVPERGRPSRVDSSEPLWVQALELIKRDVDDGVLRAGKRLPPERELCATFQISRVTLRKALAQLVEDGVLRPSHGRGWYVSSGVQPDWPNSLESFTETARRKGLTPSSVVLRAETRPASLDEADELSIAAGTPLFRLERIRLLDKVPIGLDHTHLPESLVPNAAKADFAHDSLYEKLIESGQEIVRADSTIEACPADEHAAEHLGLKVGDPVLKMHQLVVDGADRPIMASTIRYRGDRYRLRTFFARSSR